ncbi:hypothetical protein MUN88_17210 [Gracilibacillus caseinilyticus]|uniref:Uncharacterized protein n=1 Tax=Gracilibacillus caseinilyticus TaxID=2932256 RepID=A0ABY4F006_9BACI|nr:hypothetical protein [Gracilibacillus caseinilyticus]UOQ47771.1 hypothetical protein MUN88_17210 [Gracilibacillus caseinilyticus]
MEIGRTRLLNKEIKASWKGGQDYMKEKVEEIKNKFEANTINYLSQDDLNQIEDIIFNQRKKTNDLLFGGIYPYIREA